MFHLPTVGHPHQASSIPSLWDFLEVTSRTPAPGSCIFLFILLATWASLRSSLSPTSYFPLPLFYPCPSFSLLPMTILFSLLSRIQASSLGASFLIKFFGSVGYIMSILYFLENIHSLVSTYNACHFGSGLPHSG